MLLVIYLTVFVQAADNGIRSLFNMPLNLLPAFAVYAGFAENFAAVVLVAIWGSLCFDTLSANPLGASLLPLFVVGCVIHRKRDLILRNQLMAQFFTGLVAGATVPALSVLVLLSIGYRPLLGWWSFGEWLILSLTVAVFTPACFRFFDMCNRALNYRPWQTTSFRPDREIRRGRF